MVNASRRTTLACIAAIAAAQASLTPTATATPPDCDHPMNATGFTPTSGDWSFPGNWDNGVPDAGKVACIDSGQTANIPYDESGGPVAAVAKAIWIKGGGTVFVGVQNSLKIYENSQVDGDLKLDFPQTELIIHNSLTITGDGGEIICGDYYGFPDELTNPTIKARRATMTLTLAGDGAGESNSLVVRGNVGITASLVNNAYIVADDRDIGVFSSGDMVISGLSVSGSGDWIARENTTAGTAGRLLIKSTVTGSGKWLAHQDVNAEIQFDAACTGLTGDIEIKGAKLTINENLATTGDLIFKSDGVTARITLASGKTASFD